MNSSDKKNEWQQDANPLDPIWKKDRLTQSTKREQYIFWGTLLVGFLIQTVLRVVGYFQVDQNMWADQIRYFLTHDRRVFDFYAAYGHPGTTLVELGSLFHVFFGFSYNTALTLGISILIAITTSVCAVICSLLYPRSLWWLAAAFTLLLNRMYLSATPPTAVVMPLVVLMVLATWWLWERQDHKSKRLYLMLGAVMGLAAATRLDAALFVSAPLFTLVWFRHGRRVVLPIFTGVGIGFFITDPFLWFMPIQHITDLVHKFTMHYAQLSPVKIELPFFVDAIWLSAVSFVWSFVLFRQQRLARIIPAPIMIVFSSISSLALVGVFSSKFQATRYLFPLIIVWEVLLPLFILETLIPTNRMESIDASPRITAVSLSVIVLVSLMQVLAFLHI